MLDAFLKHALDPAAEPELLRAIDQHTAAVLASAGRGRVALVAEAEHAAQASPGAAFTFDAAGAATLTTPERTWHAGRFEVLSIGELRARAAAAGAAAAGAAAAGAPEARATAARARLWVLEGVSPATDIGSLQATTDGALFQVASQFNCLESPGPYVVPVVDYLLDSTQGPRAAISAFPGTLLRHYAAPGAGGERFVQATDERAINLLSAVCDPGVASVHNGYLMPSRLRQPAVFAAALEARFDQIQVGVHDDLQVALGYDWDGSVEGSEHRRIAQVCTSTVAGGGAPAFAPVCRQLLRAAYLGTLLAAAALGRSRVVLTLIGGGVFGNPIPLIWEAIDWALNEVEPHLARDLDVVINSRTPAPHEATLAAVRARGGALLSFAKGGAATIYA